MNRAISSLEELLIEVKNLLTRSERRIIVGIVGEPGAGKSTVTDFIFQNLENESAALLPMDGFHYSNQVLKRLGRTDRKGAPDTFDASGFTALLSRIKSEPHVDIYFPIFHRDIEESIAAEGVIPAGTKLIITEGNYLLLQSNGFAGIKPLLDESWYLQIDSQLRQSRLIERHQRFGKDPAAAKAWALGSDEQNGVIIRESAPEASRIIAL